MAQRTASSSRSGTSLAALLTALLAGTTGGCGESSPPARDSAGAGGASATAGTLRRLDPPAAPGAMAPRLVVDGGAWLLSWLEPETGDSDIMAMRVSRLDPDDLARGWSEPVTVTRSNDLFSNWADNPSLHPGGGAIVAHWLQRSGKGRYAYDVRLALSTDGGRTWTPAGTAHNDGTPSEHGFVSSAPGDGGAWLFWLDGREMAGDEDAATDGHGGGAMTLRGGLALAGGGGMAAGAVLDDRVCECCQTAAALTADGPVVVYRDRGPDEERDIWIVRREGGAWSPPRPVHVDGWRLPGCPVNGPDVAADPADSRRLAVAWFTGADERPRVQIAFSGDGGRSFGEPVVVDDASPLGRVDVAWSEQGEALVLWLARGEENRALLRLRRVTPAGAMAPASTLAATRAARAAGFPRMAQFGDSLALVWTTVDEAGVTDLAVGVLSPAVEAAAGSADSATTSAGTAVTPGADPPADGADPPVPARPWDTRLGSQAPEYAATTLEGEPASLAGYRGRPLLVNVWATWCGPCRQEMPVLAGLHRELSSAGLQVVGISVDAARLDERVRQFVAEEQIPYPILRDPEDRATGLFGLTALPASYLFNRDGVLVWSRLGLVREGDEELAAALAPLLAGAAGS